MIKRKREFRELSDETRRKISQSSSNKPKADSHKQHISPAVADQKAGITDVKKALEEKHTTGVDIKAGFNTFHRSDYERDCRQFGIDPD